MLHSIYLKSITLLVSAITVSSVMLAQETPPEDRVVEIGFSTGFGKPYSTSLSNETWSKYTPDFVIPADSLGYQESHSPFRAVGETATILSINAYVLGSVHVSYRNAFLDSKNIRSSFGIVFGSGIGYRSDQSWTKETIATIDTLTSSQTGQQYPVDSIHNHTIGRAYTANELMVGVSHFFQTDPTRRLSLYLGISASYGFSVNSTAYTYESNWSRVESGAGATNSFENEMTREDLSNAPKAHSVAIQIPVELCFKPWKNRKGWYGLSAAMSFRPTFKHFSIADKKGTVFNCWGGITLRYTI